MNGIPLWVTKPWSFCETEKNIIDIHWLGRSFLWH